MKEFNVIALANTFALIDLILHSAFRVWVLISPSSYINAMHLFVEGLELRINPAFDLNLANYIKGTILEVVMFWVLGASIGIIYNRLAKR